MNLDGIPKHYCVVERLGAFIPGGISRASSRAITVLASRSCASAEWVCLFGDSPYCGVTALRWITIE